MTQTKEQKQALEEAKGAAPSKEEQERMLASVPPLVRDEDYSFVEADAVDRPALDDPELATPNLTGESLAEAEAEFVDDKTLTMTRPDRAKSTYKRSAALTEVDLERMTPEQIKKADVLAKATPRYHPARLAPSSDRPRQPTARVPAAGAGSWPLNESQMPAVMPTDPPVEDRVEAGDNGFAKRAGFSTNKDGTLVRKGLRIGKQEVTAAAALYAALRQQYPDFTTDQLADEFELRWLSGTVGQAQSHRAGAELSTHGLTAVGDARLEETPIGKLRATSPRAFEADPEQPPVEAGPAGAPSTNEPASTAPDSAKKPSGETVKADAKAAAEFAKFDPDGDGRPGGAPPGGNKKKS